MPHMKLVTVHLPRRYIKDLDGLVRRKLYGNRNEAIRAAVLDLLREESWGVRRT